MGSRDQFEKRGEAPKSYFQQVDLKIAREVPNQTFVVNMFI